MWGTVKLGDVCELAYGKALDKKDRLEIGGYPAYGANGIKTQSKVPLYDKPSIIVGRKGSAGEINKVTEPFWALDVTYYTKADEQVITLDYLFYVLTTLNLPSLARGVKPGINRNDVYEQTIPLPPLAEQQRIVAKLDAAFAAIDRAIKGATSRQSELGVLKDAAIDSHFQSLQNEKKMGDVFEFVRGPFGGSLKKNMFVAEGFAVYEQQHAIKNECREFRYFVPQEKFDEMSRFRVSPNAILMSCSGTIGKTTIIPPNFVEGIINQALLMLKPNDEVIPKFATLYMDSKRFSQQLMERVEGAAQKNVASVKVLKEILIPLPNIEEQQQLVSHIEQILCEIEIAQSINESKIDNYMQLKSAILAQELQPPQSEAA